MVEVLTKTHFGPLRIRTIKRPKNVEGIQQDMFDFPVFVTDMDTGEAKTIYFQLDHVDRHIANDPIEYDTPKIQKVFDFITKFLLSKKCVERHGRTVLSRGKMRGTMPEPQRVMLELQRVLGVETKLNSIITILPGTSPYGKGSFSTRIRLGRGYNIHFQPAYAAQPKHGRTNQRRNSDGECLIEGKPNFFYLFKPPISPAGMVTPEVLEREVYEYFRDYLPYLKIENFKFIYETSPAGDSDAESLEEQPDEQPEEPTVDPVVNPVVTETPEKPEVILSDKEKAINEAQTRLSEGFNLKEYLKQFD